MEHRPDPSGIEVYAHGRELNGTPSSKPKPG
jgi:hypothetical protein